MNQMNPDKAAQMAYLNNIHRIEGFDPTPLAVEYMDMNRQEKRKRLPVMAQMAWFRLKYPEGKISLQVEAVRDHFVASARVYPNYKDSTDCFLAEATASRGHDANNPTVSPREWAQTAAVGIALRNAGFGLQFGAAGDEFEPVPVVELDYPTGSEPSGQALPTASGQEVQNYEVTAEPVQEPPRELTLEEKYQQAIALPCPISKFSGKTLGEVLTVDANAIKWLATKFTGGADISAAAKVICEYAMQHAQATA